MNLRRDVFSSQLDLWRMTLRLNSRWDQVFRVDLSKYFLQTRVESTGTGSGCLCCLRNRSSDTQAPRLYTLLHLKHQSPKIKIYVWSSADWDRFTLTLEEVIIEPEPFMMHSEVTSILPWNRKTAAPNDIIVKTCQASLIIRSTECWIGSILFLPFQVYCSAVLPHQSDGLL